MKADETTTSTTAIGESDTISSPTQILQKLNKEIEKKEAGAEAMRTRCKICFRETSPNPKCAGHGGGSGGGGSGGSSEEKATRGSSLSNMPSPVMNAAEDSEIIILSAIGEGGDFVSQSDENSFDPEIIAALIKSGLLVIDNDRESKTVSIRLLCEPKSLSREQREELNKYAALILNEWKAFKEDNQIVGDEVKITFDKEENFRLLTISLPTLGLYDKFIQQLADNLLPSPCPTEPKPTAYVQSIQEEKADLAENTLKEQSFNPSPFSIEMKPWE